MFLDIDGVLNSAASAQLHYWKPKWYNADLSAFGDISGYDFGVQELSNLRYILTEIPDLKIVISSSWKIGRTVEELRVILGSLEIDPERIIGKTPFLDLDSIRGHEIKKWLDNNELCQYVVIDDDTDMDSLDLSRFVHVEGYNGLSYTDAMKIIELYK